MNISILQWLVLEKDLSCLQWSLQISINDKVHQEQQLWN